MKTLSSLLLLSLFIASCGKEEKKVATPAQNEWIREAAKLGIAHVYETEEWGTLIDPTFPKKMNESAQVAVEIDDRWVLNGNFGYVTVKGDEAIAVVTPQIKSSAGGYGVIPFTVYLKHDGNRWRVTNYEAGERMWE